MRDRRNLCKRVVGTVLAMGALMWALGPLNGGLPGLVSVASAQEGTDVTPPAPFGLGIPEDGVAVGPTPLFTWEATTDAESGLTHYELRIDGKIVAASEDESFALMGESALSVGEHTWQVIAYDSAENARENEGGPRSFTVESSSDSTSPAPFGLIEPVGGISVGHRPTFAWEAASDAGSGIERYELFVAHEVPQKLADLPAGTETFTPGEDLPLGLHKWWVVAVDKAGNSTEPQAEPGAFEVVPQPPGPFDLVAPEDEATHGPRPMFRWEAPEGGSSADHYELWLDGSEFAEIPGGTRHFVPESDLSDEPDPHEWRVVAVNASGQETASTETRSFTVDVTPEDQTPPGSFALESPANEALVGGNPEFSWEAATGGDVERYEFHLDGTKIADLPAGVESFTPAKELLASGSYTWSVTAFDTSGNSRDSEVWSVEIDAEPPATFDLLAPANETDAPPQPTFSWEEASDLGAGLDHYELYASDGGTWAKLADIPAGTETFTPATPFGSGDTVEWGVVAVDKVGNERFSSGVWRFQANPLLAPPEPFGLLAPEESEVVGAQPRLSWEETSDLDFATYRLFLDDEEIAAEPGGGWRAFTLPSPLDDGAYSWYVEAEDQTGQTTATETRQFFVDTKAPEDFDPIEPADGAVVGSQPTLTWKAATDPEISGGQGPGSGLDRYLVLIDESSYGEVFGSESFTPPNDLAAGSHEWYLQAYDVLGNVAFSAKRSFIVASPPSAELSAPSGAFVGSSVSFDASGSDAPADGAITSYEWDLDGNGSFERSTGTTPTTSKTYGAVTDVDVSVRVNTNLGTSDTKSADLIVRQAPPPGPLGVSINGGAQFTNSPSVTVSAVWPLFALNALVSNDGGFGAAAAFPVTASIPWTLDSSGPERLPKTIYVRFQGGQSGAETYQDDIILDETDPEVVNASEGGGGGASTAGATASASTAAISAKQRRSKRRRGGKRRKRTTLLRIRARDNLSGVHSMQLLRKGRGATKWIRFRPRIRLRGNLGRTFVRVSDQAGNTSKWKRALTRRELRKRRRAAKRRKAAKRRAAKRGREARRNKR